MPHWSPRCWQSVCHSLSQVQKGCLREVGDIWSRVEHWLEAWFESQSSGAGARARAVPPDFDPELYPTPDVSNLTCAPLPDL